MIRPSGDCGGVGWTVILRFSATVFLGSLLWSGCAIPTIKLLDGMDENHLAQELNNRDSRLWILSGTSKEAYDSEIRKRIADMHPEWDQDSFGPNFRSSFLNGAPLEFVKLRVAKHAFCEKRYDDLKCPLAPNCVNGAMKKGCSRSGAAECCTYQAEISCSYGQCEGGDTYMLCRSGCAQWVQTSEYHP